MLLAVLSSSVTSWTIASYLYLLKVVRFEVLGSDYEEYHLLET
jgi:hypothetical protein